MSSLSSFYLCNTGYCIDSFEHVRLPPERTLFAVVDLVAIRLSSLNVFEITCCILLDSKSRQLVLIFFRSQIKSRDVPCDLHRLLD